MQNVTILAILCALLALAALILGLRLALFRRSVEELERKLQDWLNMGETNTLLTIASGERCMRRLASTLNAQIRTMRAERWHYQSGNARLHDAVTNVSHDLRTPLTAILGYIDLLEREELSKDARRHVTIIRERAESMRALTEELFRFSVIGADGQELKLEPVRLNAALEEALAAAYSELCGRGIAPEVEMPETPVVRTLNRAALGRILGNILANAAKYSDGDLHVELDERGTMTFSNAAPSLNEVQVGRLFDRFYTVESARQSTGLGLAIARSLTEQMGGETGAEYRNGRLTVWVRFGE